jgi:hypothetical protein
MQEKPEYFDTLNDFLSRHPEYEDKSKNMQDFEIDQCPLAPKTRKAYRIFIKKTDGTSTDISWRCALTGCGKSDKAELFAALRVAVHEQVLEFRMKSELKCNICNKTNTIMHVDHVKQFNEIAMNFLALMKEKSIKIPCDFDDATDGTYRRTFKECDSQFCKDWCDYHENEAEYRILCQKCNLTRKKGKRTHIIT